MPATVDGVLGGFGHLSNTDLTHSRAFLKKCLKNSHSGRSNRVLRALDCGAGVGRITRYLLSPLFGQVDLLEPNARFLEQARVACKNQGIAGSSFFCEGMQTFQFSAKYDALWIQWVSNYLKDEDLVAFLQRARNALLPKGFVGIKENVVSEGSKELFDKEDASTMRTDAGFRALFQSAGFAIAESTLQTGFPADMFPVRLYCLRPLA